MNSSCRRRGVCLPGAAVWCIAILSGMSVSSAAPAVEVKSQILSPLEATLESPRLILQAGADGLLSLRDKRTNCQWKQVQTDKKAVVTLKQIEAVSPAGLRLQLQGKSQAFSATLALVADGAEVEITLAGDALPEQLCYPLPFLPLPEASVILAIKEGLAIPARDTTVFFDHQKRSSFQFFEGHNAAMPFWGFANRNGSGLMTLIVTPNDAGFRLSRRDGLLTDQVIWQPEFGRFGYARKLRYIPLERGGYVAMAQRYRAQAQQDGLVKTLREKIRENPKVERLLGAADVWFCDYRRQVPDSSAIARQMQQLGITHAIFNGGSPWWDRMSAPEAVVVAGVGYLPGGYENFQDVMDPAIIPRLRGLNPIFPRLQKAWPAEVVLTADGVPLKGWPEVGKDGQTYYCGRLSDRERLPYVKERISELAAVPYGARFIDTEAATPWTENYNPRHRTTRSQARAARMQVFDFIVSAGLVTGSEGLSAYAAPHLHFFEGVGPIEPFRVPKNGAHPFQTFPAEYDWGSDMTHLLEISHRYLIPLWQLVFHDCVVAYSRWDEANNKFAHPLWKTKQTLFCALNGRPPIFMFNPAWWSDPAHRQTLAEIYRQTGPLARKVGLARMLDHVWLDASGDLQRTQFENGVTVTVNFAQTSRTLPDGTTLGPLSASVREESP